MRLFSLRSSAFVYVFSLKKKKLKIRLKSKSILWKSSYHNLSTKKGTKIYVFEARLFSKTHYGCQSQDILFTPNLQMVFFLWIYIFKFTFSVKNWSEERMTTLRLVHIIYILSIFMHIGEAYLKVWTAIFYFSIRKTLHKLWKILFIQYKQSPDVFYEKRCSWKFHKIHRKTP